jgi:hypothetical protein
MIDADNLGHGPTPILCYACCAIRLRALDRLPCA